MKIIVLSDTHFRKGYSLNDKFIKELSDSDRIIHCGDFVNSEFYNFLNASSKLIAVRGNNDYSIANLLPTERNIYLEGFKITIIHGHLVNIENLHYKYPNSDIIIYGHLHHPSIEQYNGKLIISPGSLTSNRYVAYNSFMTMSLNRNQLPVIKIHKLQQTGEKDG